MEDPFADGWHKGFQHGFDAGVQATKQAACDAIDETCAGVAEDGEVWIAGRIAHAIRECAPPPEVPAAIIPTSVAAFKPGDRVTHTTCGPGTVTKVIYASDDWRMRGVHVTYDRIGAGGKPWRGIYDDDWFRNAGCRLVRLNPQLTGTAQECKE